MFLNLLILLGTCNGMLMPMTPFDAQLTDPTIPRPVPLPEMACQYDQEFYQRVRAGIQTVISPAMTRSITCFVSLIKYGLYYPRLRRYLLSFSSNSLPFQRTQLEIFPHARLEEIEISISGIKPNAFFAYEQYISGVLKLLGSRTVFRRVFLNQNDFWFLQCQQLFSFLLSPQSSIRELVLEQPIVKAMPWQLLLNAPKLQKVIVKSLKIPVMPLVMGSLLRQRGPGMRVFLIKRTAMRDVFSVLCVPQFHHVEIGFEGMGADFGFLQQCDATSLESIIVVVDASFDFEGFLGSLHKFKNLNQVGLVIRSGAMSYDSLARAVRPLVMANQLVKVVAVPANPRRKFSWLAQRPQPVKGLNLKQVPESGTIIFSRRQLE